nr:Uncharacterised protein [Klebsiella pneumoniae]
MFHVLVFFLLGSVPLCSRALPVHVLCFVSSEKILEKNRMYIVFFAKKVLFMLLFT